MISNGICVTSTPRPDKQASTASKARNPSTQMTNPRPASWDRTASLLILNNWRLDGLNRAWTESSRPRQSGSGPEKLVNWTELNKLNGGTWPLCPEPNWTIFPDKMVTRELNSTELQVPNHFELRRKRPCKFTNSSGPACHNYIYIFITQKRV